MKHLKLPLLITACLICWLVVSSCNNKHSKATKASMEEEITNIQGSDAKNTTTNNTAENAEGFVKRFVEKCWVHSREEDPSYEINIYRPCDYKKFPASRFRHIMDLRANNECEYLVLSPVDAHYNEKGSWHYGVYTRILKLKNKDGEVVLVYNVLEVEEDFIKVSKVQK